MNFEGFVRVIDQGGGAVLDLVEATLGPIDHPGHTWGGRMLVYRGSGLAGKRIPVRLDVPGHFDAEALLQPTSETDGGERVVVNVLGAGPSPFTD